MDRQQAKLLAHLHEAGGRPVSFEELRSVGIENPAVLCYELDLVGVPITRVYHYPAPGHAVPVGVRIEPGETPPEAAEWQASSEDPAPTERIGRTERIAAAVGLAATRRFGRSDAGLAPSRRFIRTKPIVSREAESAAGAIEPVEQDGPRPAGARAAPRPREARARVTPGLRAARARAAPRLRAAASAASAASVGLGALLAHPRRLLGEHGRARARARESSEPVRARARETRELVGARANAALAAGTAFARRTDSRVLAGAIALTALAVAGVALALTGQSGSSRISPAAVHGAVRAQGLAVAGPRRLQGAGSGSSSGGGLAARSSARAKAAASGGSGRGSARGGTQSGHEHAQPGSVPAAQLEARGHKLLGEGHYAAAIGDFRAALAASGQTSARCGVPGSEACLTYAYALYDLGRALRLAGKPGAAVPVLTKRLRIDNQRRTVQNELGLAKKAHGTGGAAAPSPKTKRPKKTPAPAAAPAPTSTPTTTTTGPAPPPAPSSPGPTGPTGSTAPAGPTGT